MFSKQGIESPFSHQTVLFLSVPQERNYQHPCLLSEPAGLWLQPCSLLCVSITFWSLRCLFCFYAESCLFIFSTYILSHCCTRVCHRGMCQWLNKPCHLDHKSAAEFMNVWCLGASRALNLQEGNNPYTVSQIYVTVELFLQDLLFWEIHFGTLINEMVEMTKRYFRNVV